MSWVYRETTEERMDLSRKEGGREGGREGGKDGRRARTYLKATGYGCLRFSGSG